MSDYEVTLVNDNSRYPRRPLSASKASKGSFAYSVCSVQHREAIVR